MNVSGYLPRMNEKAMIMLVPAIKANLSAFLQNGADCIFSSTAAILLLTDFSINC